MVSLFSLSLEISFDYCLLTQTRHTLAFLREILAADALVGMLPGRGPGRGAQAAQARRQGLQTLCRRVGRLDASDASRPHRHHARGARLPGAGVGDSLQERPVAVVALQETPGQVQDRPQTAQESQCRTTGRL